MSVLRYLNHLCFFICSFLFIFTITPEIPAADIDLTGAQVFLSPGMQGEQEQQALRVLLEEIQERTSILLPVIDAEAAKSLPKPAIALLLAEDEKNADGFSKSLYQSAAGKGATAAEGYVVCIDKKARKEPTVIVHGYDQRGVLFGIGALLRNLKIKTGVLSIADDLHIDTSPAYPIRGHQLGFRDVANSYDAWDIDQYESYIRDLAVFGCNSIELIPTIDPDLKKNQHMQLSPWEMNAEISKVLARYGLNVWIWVPIHNRDVSKPAEAEAELAECRRLFEHLPRLDAVFLPGGDPGDTPADVLAPYLTRLRAVLNECHPDAELWLSPQGFEPEEVEFLWNHLQQEKPNWLTGIVFGPWIRTPLPEVRKLVPEQYPIRNYPDITHNLRCQFPVPDWDQAFAVTLGREPVNPRPIATAYIHNLQAPYTIGSISYSDGINDDVNKVVWSVLGWDPNADVREQLTQFAGYAIDSEHASEIADGWYLLEKNWVGLAHENLQIPKTLKHWQRLEKALPKAAERNWRFQHALYRAYYDAYVACRSMFEKELEAQAMKVLSGASSFTPAVCQKVRDILARADSERPHPEYRQAVLQYGKRLFESIGMQLDVENYGALNAQRGANLEYLDEPLNNRRWIEIQLDRIEKADSADAAKAIARRVTDYENPCPGTIYDDLGQVGAQPHLVHDKTWEEDPGYLQSAQSEQNRIDGARLSWMTQAQTLYGTPLKVRYEGLDTKTQYELQATYTGRFRATMTLKADGIPIHGPVGPQGDTQLDTDNPVAFPIPQKATADGTLELVWELVDGRGCQVAEVWLMPVQ